MEHYSSSVVADSVDKWRWRRACQRVLVGVEVAVCVQEVSSSTFKVTGLFGHNVTLPCGYDTQTHGVLSLCWGRGKVPSSKCSNTILSSEDGAVVFRQSPRYQLLGRVKDGDVSLTILNSQWADAGEYGCRVEIPGWFNDQKVNIHLVMEEAPAEQPVTEDWTLTSHGTQETTSSPKTVEAEHPTFNFRAITTTEDSQVTTPKACSVFVFEEKFKAFLGAGHVGRMAAIFFVTIIIILFFIFRKRFLLRRALQHLYTSAAENIYESAPVPE